MLQSPVRNTRSTGLRYAHRRAGEGQLTETARARGPGAPQRPSEEDAPWRKETQAAVESSKQKLGHTCAQEVTQAVEAQAPAGSRQARRLLPGPDQL